MIEAAGLLAGEVGKPHGLSGEVYVVRISDDPHRFDPGARLAHADGRTLIVEDARVHGDRFLVKFVGVDDRGGAEELRGALYVGHDELRELGDGELWVHDLIGCDVWTRDGSLVGEVVDHLARPAQDLIAVRTSSGETLVPLVANIVVEVDLAARRVVIDPPQGLID
ncbi:MAG: ribosome maturation factor RimM [Actinomycetota bacterium]